jgi:hypothetical protein
LIGARTHALRLVFAGVIAIMAAEMIYTGVSGGLR